MRPNLRRNWHEQVSVSTKNEVKRQKIRNLFPKQFEFRTVQGTGTRLNDISPKSLSPKSNKDHANSICTAVVFTSVFVATLFWSLSAMAALPPISPEKTQTIYSLPTPKVTAVILKGGIFKLVIACFPGEAILTRPRYEKSYYNASMKKYGDLKAAMDLVCKNDGRVSLD